MRVVKLILGIVFSILFIYTGLSAAFAGIAALPFATGAGSNSGITAFGKFLETISVGFIPWGLCTGIWVWLVPVIAFSVSALMFQVFTYNWDSRASNFFVKFLSWTVFLSLIASVLTSFVMLAKDGWDIDRSGETRIGANGLAMPIAIGSIIVLYILIRLFGSHLSRIVNRRLQAAANSKEMRVPGRGSIIVTNLLKIFDFIFPEILVVALIMCITGFWTIFGSYPFTLLIAIGILFVGGVWGDMNCKREARRLKMQERVNNVRAIEQTLSGKK